jgi:hypothetical protein
VLVFSRNISGVPVIVDANSKDSCWLDALAVKTSFHHIRTYLVKGPTRARIGACFDNDGIGDKAILASVVMIE